MAPELLLVAFMAISPEVLVSVSDDPTQILQERERPDSEGERLKSQIRRWRECLLDQTAANPLLKREGSRASALQVITPEADALFRMLVIERRALRLPVVRPAVRKRKPGPAVVPEVVEPAPVPSEEEAPLRVERGEIVFAAGAPEIQRKLRRIRGNARISTEERGVITLHVALGALHFSDSRMGGDCTAPLWLVPCRLEGHGPDRPMTLEPADEDPSLNPSLELYLRERHKMMLPSAPDELAADSFSETLDRIADDATERGWTVEPEAWLSTFSFESLVMWRDLQEMEREARLHPVVRAFARVATAPNHAPMPEDLDTLPVPEQVPVPILETDSSQLEALAIAAGKQNLVIHGPPGTGKSQTIANLIADALGKGKTVLFVSAKMAALEVVHRRLVEQGLGDYCLEAHSARSGKTKIIAELRRVLENAKREPESTLSAKLEDLHGVRDRLNGYVRGLHARRGSQDVSLYDAIGRAEASRSAAALRFALPWPDPLSTGPRQLAEAIDALEELGALAEVYDGRAGHEWRGYQPPEGRGAEPDLEERLDACARSPLAMIATTFDELDTLAALADECDEARARLAGRIDLPAAETIELLREVRTRWEGWDRFFSSDYWRWIGRVAPHLIRGTGRDLDSLRDVLSLAEQVTTLEAQLEREPLRAALDRRKIDELRPSIEALERAWPAGIEPGRHAGQMPLGLLAARCRELLEARGKLDGWRRMLLLRDRAAKLGLSPLLEALGTRSVKGAVGALERRFWFAWVEAAVEEDETLSAFHGERQETLIDRFREIDAAARRAALHEIHERASARAVEVREAPSDATEVVTLRRELVKRRSGRPLRKLFAAAPRALQALKPCMLMSPVSVSTWLPPGSVTFDLVVFDEASQIPTAQAVPAILRAAQTVVAGDPKQLPPTSFFEAAHEEGEDSEENGEPDVEPLESLLDECVASVPFFHEAHLRWHYRSQDERLIQFSNHWFYEDRLITFPSTAVWAADHGVRFVHVPDGTWDRGRTRRNVREAHRVAEIVLELVRENPDRSLGVIAMNIGQKEAIEDAIAERLAAAPELRRTLDAAGPEPFFVKSLENVQGDERDVIVVSLGYARDEAGSLALHFGPLNAEGGWRRLNVLVTRAKRQTVVVSSLRASDLSGVNPANRGASALRGYLEYAENGGDLRAAAAPADVEGDAFAESVRSALVERGWEVDPRVGIGGCRIDLGVRHPDDPSRYVLGVECDGRGYASARNARDRDLLRRTALEAKGWRLHHVWSADWFRDRERTLERLIRAINRARSSSPVEVEIDAQPPQSAMRAET